MLFTSSGSASYAAVMLANRVAPSGRPSRRGTFNAYNTLMKAIVLLNDISACQSCPASARPTGFPFSTMLERIIISGCPGSWNSAGDMHLQLAELTAECHLCCRIKRLLWEADHAVIGQRLQHETQLRLAERLREIHAVNGAAECLTRWFYLIHQRSPLLSFQRHAPRRVRGGCEIRRRDMFAARQHRHRMPQQQPDDAAGQADEHGGTTLRDHKVPADIGDYAADQRAHPCTGRVQPQARPDHRHQHRYQHRVGAKGEGQEAVVDDQLQHVTAADQHPQHHHHHDGGARHQDAFPIPHLRPDVMLIQIPRDHGGDAQRQPARAGDHRNQNRAQHDATEHRGEVMRREQGQRLRRVDVRFVDLHEHADRNTAQPEHRGADAGDDGTDARLPHIPAG